MLFGNTLGHRMVGILPGNMSSTGNGLYNYVMAMSVAQEANYGGESHKSLGENKSPTEGISG